ncbi:MAG TPA: hypothetical protein VNT56_04185, partial [Acidimicrobiales bacterium]|nr:hypothetical protein [Acidimicrobiales bacterium]
APPSPVPPDPGPRRSSAPPRVPVAAAVVLETHRVRSAGLLVVLLAVLGVVLALLVAGAAAAAVVALRAALGG